MAPHLGFCVELIGQLSNPRHLAKLEKLASRTGSESSGTPLPPRPPRQHNRKLSPDHIEALVAAYKTGASIKALASTYRIHRTTVVDHLERQRVFRRATPLADTDLEKLVELYAKGWSLARIGQRFGVRPTSVRYRLRQAGINLRPRNGWSKTSKSVSALGW
jgi:hypothetical protein